MSDDLQGVGLQPEIDATPVVLLDGAVMADDAAALVAVIQRNPSIPDILKEACGALYNLAMENPENHTLLY